MMTGRRSVRDFVDNLGEIEHKVALTLRLKVGW
jgi:hypothetical protein